MVSVPTHEQTCEYRLHNTGKLCAGAVLLVFGFSLAPFIARSLSSTYFGSASRNTRIEPARLSTKVTVRALQPGRPTINLGDGRELQTSYVGPEDLTKALEQNLAEPLSLASADFDEDGVPDLVSGYGFSGRGIVTLLRGNVDTIYPNAPEARQRKVDGTFTDAPFLSPARVFHTPVPVEFIGAGDFNADGHLDFVAAKRSGQHLFLLPGDGKGNFLEPREIRLPGQITSFTSGEMNRADGLTDVVVGVASPERNAVLVFEGPEGALKSEPEIFELHAPPTSLVLGQFDGLYAYDLAIAAGNDLVIVAGRDRKLSLDGKQQATVSEASVTARPFNFAIQSLAVGNFAGDHSEDLAVLATDGRVHFLNQNSTDNKEPTPGNNLRQWELESPSEASWPGATQLIRAPVSTSAWDDLLVIEAANSRIQTLTRVSDLKTAAKRDAFAAAVQVTSLTVASEPSAILPMRLDVDALSDLVVLRNREARPAVMFSGDSGRVSAATATFSNPAAITFNGSFSPPTASTPYPSNISVSGQGAVTKVRVRLFNFTRTIPADVDLLLVGPGGQKLMLMSDAGASVGLNNALITFDDDAENFIAVPAGPGTYKPTNTNDGSSDTFPAPAPAGPYASTLSTFNGTDPNGTWSLYAVVDSSFSGGGISGGWSLVFGDDPPATTFTVINTNDSGAGSLRQAIIDSNNNFGADIITFNIPGGGVKTIAPASGLPEIFDPVTIDATTQPGFAGTPIIEIDGTNAMPPSSPDTFGVLTVRSGKSVIRGLTINRFSINSTSVSNGIAITRNGQNIIEGNFIGTDPTGTLDRGNLLTVGVDVVQTSNNLIGGTVASARNLISGIAYGVYLSGQGSSGGTSGNLIQGNFIGTNINGASAIQNSHSGVIANSATNNTIGGLSPGARNLLSGNAIGVDFFGGGAQGNMAQANLIGTNASGTGAVANTTGVQATITARNNLIGGTSISARNVISGNTLNGVIITEQASSGNLVQGNFIGTTITGTARLSNQKGVFLLFSATGNAIGGAVAGARNIISGNFAFGIQVGEVNRTTTLSNVIQGNYIGTDVSGNNPLGNGTVGLGGSGDGIIIPANADGDRIEGNRIAYNVCNGVRITNVTGSNTPGIRILIVDNEIFANGCLGIDLGDAGITPNDPQDADSGPNLLQNFPVLTSAVASAAGETIWERAGEVGREMPDPILAAALTINGTLNSTPNTNFTVHWYFSADAQCTTNQAASRPLAFGKVPDVITNGSGNAMFSIPFDFPNGINGGIVNCTATDPQGNTSEFSACFPVSSAPGPTPTPTPTPTPSPSPSPPTIFVEQGTNNLAAVDSITFVRGPFTLTNPKNFTSDQRTRILFFTTNLGLPQTSQPPTSTLSVQVNGGSHPVETVGPNTTTGGSQIVFRLPDLTPGTYPLGIRLNGVNSTNTPNLVITGSSSSPAKAPESHKTRLAQYLLLSLIDLIL